MPGAKCSICNHADRQQAETLIAGGLSVRKTAKQLALPYQSLDRHQRNCARTSILKAAETREVALGSTIMDRVEDVQAKTLELYTDARNGRKIQLPDGSEWTAIPDAKEARLALAGARKNLELIARLSGQLNAQENADRGGVTFEEFERIIFERRRTTEVRS